MTEETGIRGYVESFKDGFVRGWVAITPDVNQPNSCDLYIDEQFISCIEANVYREDLKDASVRSGIAGFLAPVPLSFCDGSEHNIELYQSGAELLINSKTLKLAKIRHLTPLDENIVFDCINKPHKNNKKVLFLAGFTNQAQLLNYQKHFVRQFQLAGFYVIYIISSDKPENLTSALGVADRVIIRQNFGYDFGSWATATQHCKQEFLMAENIIMANDSVIGPLFSVTKLLDKIEQSVSDFWAITDSQDRKYHFQSYFWGLKKKSNQFQAVIDAFFFYRYPLPKDKEDAISQYEVEALSYFKSKGMSVDILFPEYNLISPAADLFALELEKHENKWRGLFKLPLNKDENHKLNEGIFNLAMILIRRQETNSSHLYWNVLIDNGFPFIKRELMTLNPLNYPFPHKFRELFEEHKLTRLIDDLALVFKVDRII